MRRTSTTMLVSVVFGGLMACGSDPVTVVPADSGTPTDTTTPTDTSTPTDTTTPTDNATPMDNGNPTDTGNPDTGTPTDGGTTDTPRTDSGPADAGPPYDPCAMGAVVDLSAMGMTSGATTRITSNNNMVGAMAPLRGPCGRPGHEVVFRYTPRTNARLRISTDNPGTLMTLDTVVWAQATCATLPTGMSGLGCDDDTGTTRPNTSVFTTTAAAMMGTPIFIVVAGYTPHVTDFVEQGAFELSVTELTEVAVGGACDNGVTNFCATGSSCAGAAGMQRCVADGVSGGRCRATTGGMMACDAMLTCSIGTCVPTIALGGACGGTTVGVCATGSSCGGPTDMRRCLADGVSGGRCRATTGGMMACDAMLTCSFGTCAPAIAVGGACGGTIVGVCTASNCAGPAGMQRCVAPGAAGGDCRATTGGMTACDAMLTCDDDDICIRTVAAAGACDLTDDSQVCAAMTTCAPMGTTVMTTCQMNGAAAGTACRAAAPRCDTGLECSATGTASGRCQRPAALGDACDARFGSTRCAMGTACAPSSATAATCRMGVAETEPNNTAMMPQAAVTVSTVFTGAVGGTADPMDCYAVTVPANGSIFAETSVPAVSGCTGNDTVVTVFNAAGTQVARNDDGAGRGLCSLINPVSDAGARGLPAGNYSVCVTPYSATGMIASYVIAIGVYGP